MKKLIGITGGIGSGKSTVAHFIEEMGYPVYYSDTRAKDIVNDNDHLKNSIIQLLGAESYDVNGNYNRKFVGEKVFQNKDLLTALNSIIHPAVKLDFEKWVDHQTSDFIFKETALLFELGLHKGCYRSILVTADESIRIKRVMSRDQKTYREVEAIVQKQMPEKEKCLLADFIVYNNATVKELKAATQKMMSELLNS